ncbi:MAG: ATP-binding protein [Gammaproteobacteria bacterium]
MFLYKIIDCNGIIISNSIPSDLEKIILERNEKTFKIKINEGLYRFCRVSKHGVHILAITDELDMLKSPKTMSKELEFLFRSVESLRITYLATQKEATIHVNRLIHNLVTLNAHNIQEVYSIIPQEIMQDKKNGWRTRIVEKVNNDPYEASLSLVRVAKNCLKMKTEIAVYNTLLSGKPNITLRSHEIHRVLMNVLYVFFPDFTDKGVYVKVSESNVRAPIDYETFQVAIYHIIENTVKYIKPDSSLEININKNSETKKTSITFKMTSLSIEEDEIDKIFEEGYSGNVARRCQRSGSGIGLARVKALLGYNNASIAVEAKYDTAKAAILDHIYQDNIFQISL